tara:strand:+ start:146 stop:400 length:255 start_codon:yes stop_codon:yes gene_type:complete
LKERIGALERRRFGGSGAHDVVLLRELMDVLELRHVISWAHDVSILNKSIWWRVSGGQIGVGHVYHVGLHIHVAPVPFETFAGV